MTSTGRERRVLHYSGRVQGVGFRYTAVHVAGRYDVAGFVRNLPNGEVELVVEGTAATIDDFLGALARRMRSHIVEVRAGKSDATGEFDGFSVR